MNEHTNIYRAALAFAWNYWARRPWMGAAVLTLMARAILANCRVLILDEATPSLDSVSEGHIQAALEALMEGRTCITMAHRQRGGPHPGHGPRARGGGGHARHPPGHPRLRLRRPGIL